jgi:hypothetical protein
MEVYVDGTLSEKKHIMAVAKELESFIYNFLVSISSYKNANHYSVPKGDRGLLYIRKE